jgi:hypothetical protein
LACNACVWGKTEVGSNFFLNHLLIIFHFCTLLLLLSSMDPSMSAKRREKRKGTLHALTTDAERSRRSKTEQAKQDRPIAGPTASVSTHELSVVFLFLTAGEAVAASAVCRQWYMALSVGQPANWHVSMPFAQWKHALASPLRRHIHTLELDWAEIPEPCVWKAFQSALLGGFTALSVLHLYLRGVVGFVQTCFDDNGQTRRFSPPPMLAHLKLVVCRATTRTSLDFDFIKHALPRLAPLALETLELTLRGSGYIDLDLSGLEAYQQLTMLSLDSITNTSRNFSVIRQLASLETLHIRYMYDVGNLDYLCVEPSALRRLHTLSTNFLALNEARIKMLARLAALTRLHGRLPCYNMEAVSVHRLLAVQSILIEGNGMTDIIMIRQLLDVDLGHITHLVLSRMTCILPYEETTCLLQTFLDKNPQLLSLELCSCPLPNLAMLSHPHLQRLMIHDSCGRINEIDTTRFPKLDTSYHIVTARCSYCA